MIYCDKKIEGNFVKLNARVKVFFYKLIKTKNFLVMKKVVIVFRLHFGVY